MIVKYFDLEIIGDRVLEFCSVCDNNLLRDFPSHTSCIPILLLFLSRKLVLQGTCVVVWHGQKCLISSELEETLCFFPTNYNELFIFLESGSNR